MSSRKVLFRLYRQVEEDETYVKRLVATCSSAKSLKHALGAGILTGLFDFPHPKKPNEEPEEQKRRLYARWDEESRDDINYLPITLIRQVRNALVEIVENEELAKEKASGNSRDKHGNLKCYTCEHQELCHRTLMVDCMTNDFIHYVNDVCRGCKFYGLRYPYASMHPCDNCSRAHRHDFFEQA